MLPVINGCGVLYFSHFNHFIVRLQMYTSVYSLYFCIVLFTRFNKLNDDDDDTRGIAVAFLSVCPCVRLSVKRVLYDETK